MPFRYIDTSYQYYAAVKSGLLDIRRNCLLEEPENGSVGVNPVEPDPIDGDDNEDSKGDSNGNGNRGSGGNENGEDEVRR